MNRQTITARSGDHELVSIGNYLDEIFGAGSDTAEQTLSMLAELKQMLSDEVVHFVFRKTDGNIREAYGTRVPEIIRRYDSSGAGDGRNPQRAHSGTFPYFDIERRAWRCFKVDRFMKIDKDYVI